MSGNTHHPSPESGSLDGRVAVVTGATSGIGAAAATGLAERGANVVLVGRDTDRLDAVAAAVGPYCSPGNDCATYFADLTDLGSVRALARRLGAEYPRIDVLANNAGVAVKHKERTGDGFDLVFQTNYLAHFLLAQLLRHNLSGGRIITTSSVAHWAGRFDPGRPDRQRRVGRLLPRYGSTKRMSMLFAAEAARRWPDILSVSFHPGFVRTPFMRHSVSARLLMAWHPAGRSPAEGADTLLWLAGHDRTALDNGGYYFDRRRARAHPQVGDAATAERLWRWSLDAIGLQLGQVPADLA
ncbi:SDR family NAD(P)-dependent oxidoreductase [Nocardia flavorosea]|uniref:SDR family NAD(P)-dependent oxidoreductase n=1 Tax=Nocardia flavorosea TaxID=53429 RepID=UPI0024539156|nr:SDR family NAD(P)-dependent oxidoreductase [Nocardia flavorosea]